MLNSFPGAFDLARLESKPLPIEPQVEYPETSHAWTLGLGLFDLEEKLADLGDIPWVL